MNWYTIITDFITYVIFTYSAVQLTCYIAIGLYSIGAIRHYANKNSFTDYKLLATSPYAPSISILAPAYNEGANIIENVRSLLSVYYNNIELIVVNDGSKDNSLQQLISAYSLVKTDHFVSYQIPTKAVRGVYKSSNPIYRKLVVVDKVNGGKADALNVGINMAANDYIVCIDVDCVLEQDALLKLMKPFLETTDEKVIATGGVVRIANSCEIQHGRLLKVHLPSQYLPRMQALEYIRAFLLGRMAWSRINGLLLISGAFGAFDKEIAIKVGGYNHKTVGEDMELVVRMRRYMEELNLRYKVAFIPDPLCWTEAPVNYKILGRQRNRWTRGTIETLGLHKKMFFNPHFGLLGLVSYPYWFFFEMCAPGVEFAGLVVFLIMALLKLINWQIFFAFLTFIISFGYLYSAFAVYMEVKTYNQYRRKTDVMKLLLTALTEPFVFHPFVVWSGVRGYLDKLQNKSSWGEMTRQGLNGNAKASIPAAVSHTAPTPVLQET
ncbi:MAG: glycosyltransferase family 2 protein [Bacteroidota bacterium]|nr:glycosyltransferase family 2 protein [Bacteroidota bacterium]